MENDQRIKARLLRWFPAILEKTHDFRSCLFCFSISTVYQPHTTLGVVIQYGKWSAHQGASSEMVSSHSALFLPFAKTSKHVIYDIGTDILSLTKNDHNSTQKTPKSIIPQEIKSTGPHLSSDSVKTRFKGISKIDFLGFAAYEICEKTSVRQWIHQ